MSDLSFVPGDDDLHEQFAAVAARSYGHPVADISYLREHADLRVAVRAGRVVAGGLGLLVDQFFGGNPVPSACLGAGCVAPEARGERLATRMVAERLEPLREQGAVISTISTAANGYARHLGWEAPVPVSAWSVTTDDLRHSFPNHNEPNAEIHIEYGLTPNVQDVQRDLARQANGPINRPNWWWTWKQRKSSLDTYRFTEHGRAPTGLLSLAASRRRPHGIRLTVHDFWAADPGTAYAMLAFLGRYNTRAQTIDFRRGVLPPYPTLLHNLHRCRMTTQAWHPWMLRILDIPSAIRHRGWPLDVDTVIPIQIEATERSKPARYQLVLTSGTAQTEPTNLPSAVTFTPRQLSVWYAGGYATTVAARMAGVRAESEKALLALVRATTDRQPWLPDHF
jgi:predicted acetyltransferase